MVNPHIYILVLIVAGFALPGLFYGYKTYRRYRRASAAVVGCDPLMALLPLGAAICDTRFCLRQANPRFVELFSPGIGRNVVRQYSEDWLEGVQSLQLLLERARTGKCEVSGNVLFKSGVYCFVTVYWMANSPLLSMICQPIDPPRAAPGGYERSIACEVGANICDCHDEISWKDRQIVRIAHELSDPLNAMLGWLHLLEAKKIPVEEVLPAIHRIQNDARRQSGLIEELRKLTRPRV